MAVAASSSAVTKPAARISSELPTEPVVIIRPSPRWAALNLGDLWTYREVLYFLIWREVKVRYKQTVFGVAWALLQPLFAMLIFSIFFGRLAGIPSDGLPYPLFVYAGLVPWTFFANSVTSSGNSLIMNPNLITKVYFPRMIIPAAAVGAGLIDFTIAFLLLIGMMLFYGTFPAWGIVLLPVFIVLMAGVAFGVGMWLAALNVKYRDVRYALPFLIQMWMFATPIIYPSSLVPDQWRWALALNPLTGIVEGYRAALFGGALDWGMLGISTVITLVVFFSCAFVFRRMEKQFSDIV